MGTQATHWLRYTDDMSHRDRVDTLISRFQSPSDRPLSIATFYISQVDSYGHWYGPESDSVVVAMREVDRTIGYLISELERIGIWLNVNILLTSDHGMAEVSNDKVIIIDDIINMEDVEVYDWSPVEMLQPASGKLDMVFDALKATENNYTVYRNADIPDRYRIKNNHRVPEIMVVAESGFTITTRDRFESRGVSGGAHGFDPMDPNMNAFFSATGPAFKSGHTIEAFENIHIYEMLCEILGLNPAPKDGDRTVLEPILIK